MNLFNTLFKRILFFSIFIPIVTLADNNATQYSVGLDLGIAKPNNLGNATTFPLSYSTFFYSPNTNDEHTLVSGIAIGKILTITPWYTLQIGGSAHYISTMNVTGNVKQGISPPYYPSTYFYNINSCQYLAEAKLRRQWNNHYFPYTYVGLGIASNTASNYSTAVPSYLTVTPEYSNKTTNSFSYSLGLGVDYLVTHKLSIGLGYRFIDLGKTGLGSGMIRNTHVNAVLTQSNLYINTLLFQLNYFLT